VRAATVKSGEGPGLPGVQPIPGAHGRSACCTLGRASVRSWRRCHRARPIDFHMNALRTSAPPWCSKAALARRGQRLHGALIDLPYPTSAPRVGAPVVGARGRTTVIRTRGRTGDPDLHHPAAKMARSHRRGDRSNRPSRAFPRLRGAATGSSRTGRGRVVAGGQRCHEGVLIEDAEQTRFMTFLNAPGVVASSR